jgi:hypothetical protein
MYVMEPDAGDEEYFDAMEDGFSADGRSSVSSRGSGGGGGGTRLQHQQQRQEQAEVAEGILDRLTTWLEGKLYTVRDDEGGGQDDARSTARSSMERGLARVSLGGGSAVAASLAQRGSSGGKTGSSRLGAPPRPEAGTTLQRVEAPAHGDVRNAWAVPEHTTYMVRSVNYMATRVKQLNDGCMYRLLGADCYKADSGKVGGHVGVWPCGCVAMWVCMRGQNGGGGGYACRITHHRVCS